MNDRQTLKLVLGVLAIIAWSFSLWLTWTILDKINADGFMYLLFWIWLGFGIIVNLTRNKWEDYDNRIKKMEQKLGLG